MKARTLKKTKVNVVTLGCSKNTFDSEVMMAQLKANDIAVEDLDRTRRSDDRSCVANTRKHLHAVDPDDYTRGIADLPRVERQLKVLNEEVPGSGEVVATRNAVVDGNVGRDNDLRTDLGTSPRREGDDCRRGRHDVLGHGCLILGLDNSKLLPAG